MKKFQYGNLFYICLPLVFVCSATLAAPTTPYNWNGLYFGATSGGAFAQFDARTSTQAGSLLSPAQTDIVNQIGNQTFDTTGFLTGIGGGYNWQRNRLLLGFELDIQALSTNGVAHTRAVPVATPPGTQLLITSYGNSNWWLTARPRIGLISNNWLFYLTGGLGVTYLQSDFLFTSNSGAFTSQVNKVKSGYVAGAGIETALTNHMSLKAEYLFANFNSTSASVMNNDVPVDQSFHNSISLKNNIVRLGINYHFNDQLAGAVYPEILPELFNTNLWGTELGTRVFISTGVNGAPQPLLASRGSPLVSRLTFSNLTAVTSETFVSADHVSGLFTKGYVGAGSITNGQLNDEDFPAGNAYSNTYSNALGNLNYATVDLGFAFLKTWAGKTGTFIGYNYYAQNLKIYNCRQLAGANICSDMPSNLNNFLVLSENDYFNSLRIGLTNQMNLTNRLTLTAEAAYLPVVTFSGTDMHNARQLIGPEQSNDGDGAMLESVLDYQFNDAWSVGLGGRYWLWNMHNGSVNFDFLGASSSIREPARYNTDRYGVFLQVSYHDRKVNDSLVTTQANWQGIFAGGHVGGAWGKSNWTDPFAATPATAGAINVAGFGDKLRSTGPLGGVNLNANWQTDHVVLGIGASVSGADIRGENTVFSGLGGVNGQLVTNYFGTLVARFGLAFDRALFYVAAGPTMLNTTFKINANTGVLALGSDSQTKNTWGWTAGIGIDYVLTEHWISTVAYNYIRAPHYTISVPNVAVINDQAIAANQLLNVFTVGLNYKFDVLG